MGRKKILNICSEFADEYSFEKNYPDTLKVHLESAYLNNLKEVLDFHGYKIQFFQIYGNRALASFIPKECKI
jgi:trans-2-enoyl-CoA reductase